MELALKTLAVLFSIAFIGIGCYFMVQHDIQNDIIEELEALKEENHRLHDMIDGNITVLWEAVYQV